VCCMMMHGMDHSGHGAGSSHATPQDEAGELLSILRRRYAQGEITEQELQERKRVLGLSGEATQAMHVHH
jgi:uncharacterized membrane protein